MKRKVFLSLIISAMFFVTCKSENTGTAGTKNAEPAAVVQLTNDGFKKMIYNYDLNKEWKYEGNKPAIIDFYADWCGPCRQLSPIVEEIAREYAGKIVVYRVNTDKEKDLAQNMGITGLPTLLFIPVEGTPRMSMGLIPKESLIKAINEVLKVK
jgi:thioredoxin